MKTKINPLITALYSQVISREVFIKEYFKEVPYSNEYVLNLIEKGISNEDVITIDEAIVLLYAGSFDLNLFSGRLCELLLYPWHTKHEDIAMLLKDIADPNTINCLYKATEFTFDYLDYDDTYQLARKCIKALSSIGTENAFKKVKLLMNSSVAEISEYAKKELRCRGLL